MNTRSVNLYVPALGRLLMATIFLMSGLSKLADPAGTIAYIRGAGAPLPTVAYGGALTVELAGGILLVLGYQTRAVAAVMAGFSVAAAVLFHSNVGDLNQMIHFTKNVAIAGGFLQVIAFGAGGLSLDALLARHNAQAPQAA